LVTLLYGEAYRAAGQVLTIHIWAGIFVFLGVASTKWFITEGLQKYSSINTAFGAVANVLLNFLLIPRYGIYGAAIATVMSYAISAYFMNFVFQISRKNFYRLSSSIVTYKSQHEKTQ
jgi:O-antigen/teichoic acid export membrane protein